MKAFIVLGVWRRWWWSVWLASDMSEWTRKQRRD